MKKHSKVALLTGGAKGIGHGILKALIQDDYQVYVMDLLAIEPHEQVVSYQGNLALQVDRQAFIDLILSQESGLDLIVHNAMTFIPGILFNTPVESFEESLAMGVVAPYHFALAFKDILNPHSSIIHILSTRAYQSQANNESYAAAKGALSALTHALANSLGPKVRVNAIAPGWIDTHDSQLSEADHTQHLSGRVGQVSDIVFALRFLISDQASFIQAETLIIDGGMSKRMIYHADEGWHYHKS